MAPESTLAAPAEPSHHRYIASTSFVVAQPEVSLDALFNQHTAWIQLPSGPWAAISKVQALTNWSFREIAEILGTSHTTIGKLANGAMPTTRSQEAADRLQPLLEVLDRISRLVAPGRPLNEVLHLSAATGHQPIEYLMEGEWPEALLAALDIVNGPRPQRPRSLGPKTRSAATRELS